MKNRNAFRMWIPDLTNNEVNEGFELGVMHYFEIKPTPEDSLETDKFIIRYDDKKEPVAELPLSDSLTNDEELSQGKWVMAAANLLVDSGSLSLNKDDTSKFLSNLQGYVASLEYNARLNT